jgi:hypothetical protein
MKKTILALCLASPLAAIAFNGHDQGGGGSRVESAFRLSATDLIKAVGNNKWAQSFCPADLMTKSLNGAKVLVVDTLTDLNTGKPVDTQLDAWTRPGTIQLRKAAWEKYLTSGDRLDKSVSALVLHELYRSTGACDDDNGSLSTTVVKLLQPSKADASQKYIKLFALKSPVTDMPVPANYHHGKVHHALCEKSLSMRSAPAGVVCAFSITYPNVDGGSSYAMVVIRTSGDAANPYKMLVQWGGTPFDFLEKNLDYINAETPLYIAFQMSTGTYFYGVDLDQMTSSLEVGPE